MASNSNSVFLGSGIAGLALIFLNTLSSLYNLSSISFKTKKQSKDYQDKDGIATAETIAAYSTKIPKIFICILSILCLGVSIALAILGTLRLTEDQFLLENWLNTASSFLIVVQAICVAFSNLPELTYNLGIHGAISCALLLTVLLAQDTVLLLSRSHIGPVVPFALRITLIGLSTFTAFANVSIPRRPAVFIDGKPVDGKSTVTAFSRYQFTWAIPLLNLAAKKGSLDLNDLPRPDHKTRSKDVTKTWTDANLSKGKLWLNVFYAHKWAFILQWFLTLLQSAGTFAPQFCLLHILRVLEKRQEYESVTNEAWIWVVALGLSTLISAWLEHWLFWVSQADIAIPVRAQLSAIIFQKSMRRKDVKGAAKTELAKNKDDEAVEVIIGAAQTSPDPPPAKTEEEADDPTQKSRQQTVNLIGVDAKRIADFCSFNNYFPGALFKLLVSFAFLLDLIGWKALLAGLGTMAILLPLNVWFSKRYSDAQDRLMKVRDIKLGVVNEALQGIKQIKWTATEKQWEEKIGRVRNRELKEIWSALLNDTGLLLCWTASPIMLSAASLAVYSVVYGDLSPSVAFTSIGIFKQLEVTLAVIPELTTDLIDAYVSVERIQKYLAAPEISSHRNDAASVSFENASVAWPSDDEKEESEKYVLRDLNISFPDKELSVISGKTGTGKSLLLSSILGETDLLAGKINVPKAPALKDRHDDQANKDNWIIPSSIAFVAQIPWIENATIKNNITFGLPFDEYRYNKTIEVCALKKDLEMLTDGEDTEIGANGINLSGGQRWRLTFARALYSRAGILILDDLFSALDAHVGRFIFENALTGELGNGRTRILCTHHVNLVKSRAKYLVELGDGTVENAGLLSDLEEDGTLSKIISHSETAGAGLESEDATAVNSEDSSSHGDIDGEPLKKVDTKASAKKFVEEEAREKGAIKRAIYMDYLKSSGGFPFWTFALLIFGSQQTLTLGRSWILRLWSGSSETANAHMISPYAYQFTDLSMPDFSKGSLMYYLALYVGISIVTSALGTLRFFYVFVGSIKASRRLFEALTFTILRTPLRWIDTVPLGRILNRFTADFTTVDSRLAYDISFFSNSIFQLVGVIIAGIFVSPYIIVLAVSLAVICVYFAARYLAGAREVKRLESNAKSPIFETFNAALTGVATIRGFDKSEVYVDRMYNLVDNHSTTFWHLWLFNRWMGWRMSVVGALFAVTVSGTILLLPSIGAALAGFALSFSLEYTGSIMWTIRHYANLELDFNSAERVIEYANLQTESQDGADPPAAWPSEGRLEVNDLVVGYADDLPPVLKGLSFTIEKNERVGVVGRTGAGKSSLTLALFRFLEAREGSVSIDGLNISKIKLHALRSRLAIIPQDPVLFSGTVRSNLDAFDEHTDSELRDALLRVHLVSAPSSRDEMAGPSIPATPVPGQNQNTNPFTSLSSPITEGGLNLSQGQRQLLCLARAIVSRPKIMVLDEATSAVDMATDALIQRSIREEFTDSTLIVIAHRLSTIGDFDKILVMDDGRGVEFGSPRDLMEIEGGIFRGMVKESGEREKLENLILGGRDIGVSA